MHFAFSSAVHTQMSSISPQLRDMYQNYNCINTILNQRQCFKSTYRPACVCNVFNKVAKQNGHTVTTTPPPAATTATTTSSSDDSSPPYHLASLTMEEITLNGNTNSSGSGNSSNVKQTPINEQSILDLEPHENNAMEKQLREQRAMLESVIKQVKEEKNKFVSIEKQLIDARDTLKTMNAQAQELRASIDGLTSEQAELQAHLAQQKTEIAELETSRQTKQNELEKLDSDVTQKQNAKQELESSITSQQQVLAVLKEQKQQDDAELTRLSQEHDVKVTSLKKLQSDMDSLKKDIDKYEMDKVKLAQEISAIKADKDSVLEEKNVVCLEKLSLVEEREQLKRDVQTQKDVLEELQTTSEKLKASTNDVTDVISQQHVTVVNAALTQAANKSPRSSGRSSPADDDKRLAIMFEQEKEIKELQELNQALEDQLDELRRTPSNDTATIERLRIETERLRDENEYLLSNMAEPPGTEGASTGGGGEQQQQLQQECELLRAENSRLYDDIKMLRNLIEKSSSGDDLALTELIMLRCVSHEG